MNAQVMGSKDASTLEWLISGSASAKLLDFFITYRDFDYSETDIAESSRVSKRTVFRELPKLESAGLIKFTRNVGRAKMFKLDPESEAAKLLEKFVFEVATRRIDGVLAKETMQERIDVTTERSQETTLANSM